MKLTCVVSATVIVLAPSGPCPSASREKSASRSRSRVLSNFCWFSGSFCGNRADHTRCPFIKRVPDSYRGKDYRHWPASGRRRVPLLYTFEIRPRYPRQANTCLSPVSSLNAQEIFRPVTHHSSGLGRVKSARSVTLGNRPPPRIDRFCLPTIFHALSGGIGGPGSVLRVRFTLDGRHIEAHRNCGRPICSHMCTPQPSANREK